MARTELRYTYIAKGRYWRFRHKLVGDVPLPHDPAIHWSLQPHQPAFMARYTELLEQVHAKRVHKPPSTKSFAWLIEAYQRSAEFGELADATQVDYARTLALLVEELGPSPFATATRAVLKTVRDDHKGTVRKAHKIKQMLSRLYSWADEQDLVPAGHNPAKSIKRLSRKGGAREITVWSDAEIALFLGACRPHVRTPVLLALYTGQRRADIASMTWQQYQGDVVRVRQSKTAALLDIGCHSELRAHLDALPRTGKTICLSAAGVPYSDNGLSKAVEDATRAIDGFPRPRSMHGLRYAAGSRMEEAGCSVAEIESVLGHTTFKMALKYATQRVRAKAAVAKMEERA